MKLAAKLILIFMIGVLAIVILFSWQTIQQQRRWSQAQHEESAADLVEALKPAMEQAYREGGVVRIQQVVEVTAHTTNGPLLRWVDPEKPVSPENPEEKTSPRTEIQSRSVSSISISDKQGATTLYTYVPLTFDGSESGAVEVSKPLNARDSMRGAMIASLLSILGVAALSGVVIYWGGMQLVAKPLQKLIGQVEQIGEGELGQPPVLSSHDELGRLATAISQMSNRLSQQRETIQAETEARLQTQQQLRHVDRLGTLGTLAAGMAHELGTPLNVVAGRAGLISSGQLSADEVTSSARTIKSEAERMTTIIRQLLDFARQSGSITEVIDLTEVAAKTCDLMEPLARKSDVTLKFRMMEVEPVEVTGDPGQLQQVLTNLISNAIQAMPQGGDVEVIVNRIETSTPANVDTTATEFACLQVADTGIGMTQDETEHVFEPFYTTKDIGQGTGLGLSIAYGIVREHGGWIEVESTKQRGTTFRVFLPLKKRKEQ